MALRALPAEDAQIILDKLTLEDGRHVAIVDDPDLGRRCKRPHLGFHLKAGDVRLIWLDAARLDRHSDCYVLRVICHELAHARHDGIGEAGANELVREWGFGGER